MIKLEDEIKTLCNIANNLQNISEEFGGQNTEIDGKYTLKLKIIISVRHLYYL